MALLATYGGADDVRLCRNRILADQAGAQIPVAQPQIPVAPTAALVEPTPEPKTRASKKAVL